MKAYERRLLELREEFYDGENLNPAICEEFLQEDGMFNTRYLERVLDTKLYDVEVHAAVHRIFGKNTFDVSNIENEVTHDKFKEHYVFGKYLSVIHWIGYFRAAHNLTLTKKALFSYILVDKSL